MRGTFKLRAAAAVYLCCCLLCGCGEQAAAANTERSESMFSESVCAEVTESAETSERVKEKLLECSFYDEEAFIAHDKASEPYAVDGELLGGVVSHHLTAGKMIAGFFKTAAKNCGEIDTVVITAPMHYPENDALCTSRLDWQTPYGAIGTDIEFTKLFISELGAKENDDMLLRDHSASALLPYVKYYLPDAKVCCLLISGRADRSVPKRIAELLKAMSEEKNCLFVFSIDFSHYLTPEEADEMDKKTSAAVMLRDLDGIAEMNDDNMDSPRCMCTFLELMDLTGGEVSELDHGNSLSMSELPYTNASFGNGVTSYFVYGGTVPEG